LLASFVIVGRRILRRQSAALQRGALEDFPSLRAGVGFLVRRTPTLEQIARPVDVALEGAGWGLPGGVDLVPDVEISRRKGALVFGYVHGESLPNATKVRSALNRVTRLPRPVQRRQQYTD